jgi:hypothetical protein
VPVLAHLDGINHVYVDASADAEKAIAITLNMAALRDAFRLPALKSEDPACHTIIAPVRVTKRGVEQKLVIGGEVTTQVRRDETLVGAIARAYAWVEDIRTGRVSDISDIAAQERFPRSYVRAHLPLAFLSPKIVQGILAGKQPADLTLKQLMCRTDLSSDWPTQWRQLGFGN